MDYGKAISFLVNGQWSMVLSMPYNIHIHNQQKRIPLNLPHIINIVHKILAVQKIKKAELSIVILTDRKIQEINRKFLKHDYPTDVISFDLSDQEFSRLGEGKVGIIDGEICVSAVTAARQANLLGQQACHELLLYIVHGILHLCGYDDHTAEDRKMIRKREQEILDFLKVP